MSTNADRRTFLKLSLGGAAALAAGASPALALGRARKSLAVGESYGDFIVLSEGSKTPSFVKTPDLAPPKMCGAGRDITKADARPILEGIDKDGALLREVAKESAIFGFADPTPGLRFEGGHIVRYENGLLFHTTAIYSLQAGKEPVSVMLQSTTQFPRPQVIYRGEGQILPAPGEKSARSPEISKAPYLPAPGVLVRGPFDESYHWVAFDVLHTLHFDGLVPQARINALLGGLSLI